jgi:hypothetical protein
LETGATISLYKVRNFRGEQNDLERSAIDCESQVRQVSETLLLLDMRFVSYLLSSKTGHVKPCLKPEGPPSKAKYVLRSIVNKYREGKVKRTPDRGVK